MNHRLQPILKLAFDPGSGLQQSQVEGAQLHGFKRLRHVAGGDPQRQAFDHGRLADAGLAGEDRVVLPAPGEDIDHLADFRVARLGILIEERLRCQDDAVEAKPALGGLFVDERPLQGMRTLGRAQPLERRDRRAADRADGRHAGSDRAAPDDDGAGSALSKSASELRATEPEIVAQHVE